MLRVYSESRFLVCVCVLFSFLFLLSAVMSCMSASLAFMDTQQM